MQAVGGDAVTGVRACRCRPACRSCPVGSVEDEPEGAEGTGAQDIRLRALTRAICGPMARCLYEAVLPLAKRVRPDLLVREGMDLGTCLVGERLGVPHLAAAGMRR